MSGTWEFLLADPAERQRFPDRDAVLTLPHELAAPQNRYRRVLRLRHDGTACYFKEYGRTQWKNRWRFCTTQPHARDDAEREVLVTMALRQAGIAAPRPLLRGRSDHGSCYLCAELPGRPLRELLAAGAATPLLLQRAAAFCGEVLRQGFWLQDLSAEHLFVQQQAASCQFGLLDLHNGIVGPPGPPPRWLCRRVLRHFLRSVQDLRPRRAPAVRFAARLLRSAGRGGELRRLLRELPWVDTTARYEVAGKSLAYRDRDRARGERELCLLARVWPGRPGERVLDSPAGTGRLQTFLADRQHRVVWADGARAMLATARAGTASPPPAVQADALWLPFGDRTVDGVLMFRFLHHLPRPLLRRALAEACRVAARFVVVSFFHPCSVHHAMRRLRGLLGRRPPTRHAITLGRLQRLARQHGFVLRRHAAQLPFVSDLWLAVFERDDG